MSTETFHQKENVTKQFFMCIKNSQPPIKFSEEQISKIFMEIMVNDWSHNHRAYFSEFSDRNKFTFFYGLSNLLEEEPCGNYFKDCTNENLIAFFKTHMCDEAIDFFLRLEANLKEHNTHKNARDEIGEHLKRSLSPSCNFM